MEAWLQQLPVALLPWYEENKRDLPWRRNQQPYYVWLSEIMLQQTRVEAVKGYYSRFLAAFPTIADLAAADPNQLTKLWEGLGYYSRVHNLHKAAILIMERHCGVFPRDYDAVRALPGIGDYTAGAVCSICFEQPTPAVDGNVLRVCARVGESFAPINEARVKKALMAQLEAVYPQGRCGAFTQSLMELGATICGPGGAPKCGQCPCQSFCLAHLHGTAEKLPIRPPKKPRRVEDRTVFLLESGGQWAVVKRGDTGLLAGMWSFPNVDGHLCPQSALDLAESWGVHPRNLVKTLEKIHIFTHIQWNLRGFYLECDAKPENFIWVTGEILEQEIALPTAFRQFWI